MSGGGGGCCDQILGGGGGSCYDLVPGPLLRPTPELDRQMPVKT